jgi:hypothetical protein
MLSNTHSCVVRSSTVLYAVDGIVAVYTGARAPSTRPDKYVSFIWRLVPYRDILESPPFFFKEVRLALLTFSLLYGVSRVINEAVRSDLLCW